MSKASWGKFYKHFTPVIYGRGKTTYSSNGMHLTRESLLKRKVQYSTGDLPSLSSLDQLIFYTKMLCWVSYAESRYAEYHYAEYHYAEYHNGKWH